MDIQHMERAKTVLQNDQVQGCPWLSKTEQVGNINSKKIFFPLKVMSVNKPARFPRPWKAAIGTRSSESPILQITISTVSISHKTLYQNS